MRKFRDLTGTKFTRLTVVGNAPSHKKPSGQTVKMWHCLCRCGNTSIVRGDQLKCGHIISCGCAGKEHRIAANTRHGMYGHPVYNAWEAMKGRCYCEGHASYPFYGAKGVRVDEPWKSSFEAFRDDMLPLWRQGLSLERKDPRKNYNKDNCCWIEWPEQWNNLRKTIFAKYDDRVQSVINWAREWNMPLRRAHTKLFKFRVPRPD